MQEIIVYRNPIESAAYQHLPEIGLFVLVFGVAFFASLIIGEKLFLPKLGDRRGINRPKRHDLIIKCSIVLGLIAAIASLVVVF